MPARDGGARGLTSGPALAVFNALIAAAAVMAALAAITTAWPGIPLAAMWKGKEAAFQTLVDLRPLSNAGFALLAVYAAACAWVWRRGRRLGWQMVAAGLLGNLAADVARAVATPQPPAFLAVLLDGVVLAWVFLPGTRAHFRHGVYAGTGAGRDRG